MYETRLGLSFLSSFQSAKVPIYALSKPECLLTTPNRLVSHPSLPKDIATSKSSQRKDLCRKRPSQQRRMDRNKLQRESAPQNRSKPAPSRFSITNLSTTITVHQKHIPLLCETPILPPLAPPHRPTFHPRAPHRPDLQRPSARAPHTSNPGARSSREESKRRRRRVQKAQRRHRMASRHRSRARPELRSLPRDNTTSD